MKTLRGVGTRGRLAAIAAVAVLGFIALLAGPGVGPASATDAGWKIVDGQTGLCLDSTDGGVVGMNPCNGGNYQNWNFYPDARGFVTIQNAQTKRCLDSNYAGTVYTNPCNGGYYQLWIEQYPNYYNQFSFQNVQTYLMLDSNASGGAYTNTWNGGRYQSWWL